MREKNNCDHPTHRVTIVYITEKDHIISALGKVYLDNIKIHSDKNKAPSVRES